MKVVIQKPIMVEADTEQEVTLQVAKTTIADKNGERETEPNICLLVENDKGAVNVFFTLNQVEKFIRQLETAKQEALKYCQQLNIKEI